MEHQCNCEAAGYCPVFKRNMTERMHSICRGEVLTEEKCLAYVRLWSSKIGDQPPPKPPCSGIPCKHRGEPTGDVVDCGCSNPEKIYHCLNPNVEQKTCILRKSKPGRILHVVCAKCELREAGE